MKQFAELIKCDNCKMEVRRYWRPVIQDNIHVDNVAKVLKKELPAKDESKHWIHIELLKITRAYPLFELKTSDDIYDTLEFCSDACLLIWMAKKLASSDLMVRGILNHLQNNLIERSSENAVSCAANDRG